MGQTNSTGNEQMYQTYIDQQFKTIQRQQQQIETLIQNSQMNQDPSVKIQLEKLKRANQLQTKQYKENLNKLNDYKQSKKSPIDPHKILNIGTSFTKSDLKKAYLKAALQHHPDRGGDPQMFQKVSVAYAVLTKQLETSGYKDHHELKQSLKQSGETTYKTTDHFDVNKFNKMYEENRDEDIYDKGYGGWMKDSQSPTQPTYKGSYTRDKFNSQFEAMKQSQTKPSKQLTVRDPTEQISYKGADSIMELGKEKVRNFSGESGGLKYRDLKDAYENPTLIDVQSVDLSKRSNSIQGLESQRSNIQYHMSDKEAKKRALLQKQTEQNERERLQRLHETDQLIFQKYQRMQNRLQN
tara:strand:- start:447 stop:1505 length:1059 start_codon:yes stop_codon:yes gene_type:complete